MGGKIRKLTGYVIIRPEINHLSWTRLTIKLVGVSDAGVTMGLKMMPSSTSGTEAE